MISETLIAKILGGIFGSSIALVFIEKCTLFVLVQRFLVGVICGIMFSPYLVDYLKLNHSFDYWVSSSAVIGIVSYFVLHLLFSGKLTERFLGVKK